MPSPRPHLLIFEPDPRGHAQEWIEHLLAAAARAPRPPVLSLAVASELADRLGSEGVDGGRTIRLSAREQSLCTQRRLAVSGFARWWAMRRHLKRSGASHGLFLSIDHLSLPLGLGLPVADRPVSGILFRPSMHYPVLGSDRPTAREWIRDRRKDMLYGGMLRNPAVQSVLSLDPYFPAYAAQRYRRGDKLVGVLDPALPPPAPSLADEGLARAIPGNRVAFVLFGELTERKGVLPLLESLSRLPAELAGTVAVVLAGRLDAALRTAVHRTAARVRAAHPGLWLHLEDRRLTMGEIAALIRRSNIVLAPYQRFVGSSGILMWAARMERPVICQKYGLVGRLARDHALGLAVDAGDPSALAGAIETAVRRGPESLGDRVRMSAFAAAHSPERFARTVLDRALRAAPAPASVPSGVHPGGVFPD